MRSSAFNAQPGTWHLVSTESMFAIIMSSSHSADVSGLSLRAIGQTVKASGTHGPVGRQTRAGPLRPRQVVVGRTSELSE